MKVPAPSLAPILRSDTQGRILARILTDPDRSYSLSELVRSANSSMPTVTREVGRAEQAGIVTTAKEGTTRLVRANKDHPLYAAVCEVILATFGAPAVIAREFADIDGALTVIIFGSWASAYLGHRGRAPNDIDVLVVGSPDRNVVDDAADRAEREIGLPVQVTVRSRKHWDGQDSFVQEVKGRPLVVVLIEDQADEAFTIELEHLAKASMPA